MSSHHKTFLKSYNELQHFFNNKDYERDIMHAKPSLLKGLHSFIHLLVPHLFFTNKNNLHKLLNIHGDIINKIMNSKNIHNMRGHIIKHINKIVGGGISNIIGGSIFSHIGHFFKHVGNSIANVAKKAVSGVSSVAKKVASTVATGAKDAYDYEKNHYRAQLSSALPYVEKYALNPLVDTGATALGSFVGAPELGELAQIGLQTGEKAFNPYLQSKIKGDQTLY